MKKNEKENCLVGADKYEIMSSELFCELDYILLSRPSGWETGNRNGQIYNVRYFENLHHELFKRAEMFVILDKSNQKLYGQVGPRVFLEISEERKKNFTELKPALVREFLDIKQLDKAFFSRFNASQKKKSQEGV